ncbi:SbcC/MukB-like Walker B domain-containing protein [Hymenobacter glacialis]|uniref:SbcC/MukB-like Walker B domain-containing protein n=1 Tax=Hymenobacter glacialis TaxID=1908236 RepID=UPI000F76A2F7|nr:SbcC/MukB-like Walker B domain-containing protein [Hymenobacter glacialis]
MSAVRALEHPFAAGELGVSSESVRADEAREAELGQRVHALNTRLNHLLTFGELLTSNGAQPHPVPLPPLSEAEEATVPTKVRALVQQLRGLQQQQSQLDITLTKAQSRAQQATDQQRELVRELAKVRGDLADAREREPLVRDQLASLSSSFGLTFSGENGPELMKQLKDSGAEYQRQKATQATAEKEAGTIAAVLQQQEDERDELHKWLQNRKTTLLAQHQAMQAQQQERQQLFAGPDVAATRTELAGALERAEHQLLQADQELQKHETALVNTESQLKQREQDTAQHAETRDTRYAALVAELRTAGLPPAPTALAERLLPDDVAQRLTQQLTRHDQAVAAAQHALTETAQQLQTEEGRALTPEPLAAIAEQLAAHASQLAHLNQQLGQRQERLHSHRNGLERHAALATELDKQQQEARRWRQLAEVIGSADGKKFSEFAQGLTLARLVDLANRHLTRLTDRYRILRNPNEHLDLLILDEYQASSSRSMNSLSGGESFLVSLALALGLSELAGRKTQIDTLFIDEGFGTLDPEALDVALTALEMLQGTGKTIGIISHVEALKERVSTQINVRKGAGGVSSIRVVGL